MTGPIVTLLVSLFDTAGLFQPQPWLTGWTDTLPETPAADVVRLKPPYALVKHHSKGSNPPTELVGPYPDLVLGALPRTSARLAGRTMVTECDDAEWSVVSGDWLVIQDRQGHYVAFDLSKQYAPSLSEASLDAVNAHLAEHGVTPVSDADFRTFEQWAEERDRLRRTRCVAVLSAVTLGWLAVVGSAFWFRRRAA